MFFLLLVYFFLIKNLLIFGYRLQGLRLLLGYRYDYALHGSPFTYAHVLIENTLVQYKNGQEITHGVVLPESSV